jgi:hypothetical protein
MGKLPFGLRISIKNRKTTILISGDPACDKYSRVDVTFYFVREHRESLRDLCGSISSPVFIKL